MGQQRKQYSAAFKAKVAREALKERQTTAQLGSEFGVHPSLVSQWKTAAAKRLPELFASKSETGTWVDEKLLASLYEQIGELNMQIAWIKKKRDWSQ